ncbi:hypothetical protein HG535_0D00670 [Zygotorulaspora mrakii]|uniref:Uncharacterized protein n=1 Tax=Zygotorulaspora mrakii TaxID=42260 RepID=A0A7H9B157_ZYGMR|nr:uncharacterized protein HG535_0D00670 [Zygotorulaspora mrakii]QLG72360.1 hypothetical protein HG535_0D00670 [Zygotorulaspora mrakii]
MANFFVALWESIFQPGTTPQLIIATHLSFAALVATLGWLIFATSGNIHFIALFSISICLWLAVTWFVQELNHVKLSDNRTIESESKAEEEKRPVTASSSSAETASLTSSKKASQLRSRKV